MVLLGINHKMDTVVESMVVARMPYKMRPDVALRTIGRIGEVPRFIDSCILAGAFVESTRIFLIIAY